MKTLSILLVVVLAGLTTASSLFGGTLDQSCVVVPPILLTHGIQGDTSTKIQTFTAGTTGTMDQIGLQLRQSGTPNADLEIYIHRATADDYHVLGTLMASMTVPYTTFPYDSATYADVVTVIDLGGQAFDVVSGERFAIHLASAASGTGMYSWSYADDANYAGGKGYQAGSGMTFPFPTGDHGFQTFVVPEPATLSLLAAGVLLYRRRRA